MDAGLPSTPPIGDSWSPSSYFRNPSTPSPLVNKRPQSSLSHSTHHTAAGTTPGPSTTQPPTVRPGTAQERTSRNATISSILGLSEAQSIICAVSEARSVTPSVGIAFVNVSIGEVVISQICDNQSYIRTIHTLHMAAPSRILFMSTACPPNKPSNLYSLVTDLLQESQIGTQDRSAWSESDGLEYISNLAFRDDIEPLKVATQGKFYALSSFAAAIKYIQQHFSISFVPHSLRIQYRPSEDTMMIDISAIQSLEIMQNLRNPKSKDSLFGLMNHTKTPMGARMLRSSILQPSTRADKYITPRYDAIDELTTNEEMFLEIRKALKGFHDAEKILTKLIVVPKTKQIHMIEEQINHVLLLKSFLEAVSELYIALEPATCNLLVKVRDLCRPELTNRGLDKIRHIIEPDVAYMKSALDLWNQRTFAVKTGINGMLDVARQTYKEQTEEIHKHLDHLIAADFEDRPLPEEFINVMRKKDKIECQTLALIKLNVRIADAANEVVVRSDKVVQDLISDLHQEVPHLFKLCESIALVDMVSSFGQLATTRDYVRPEIGAAMALHGARHPVLDKTMDDGFVPNDYFASESYAFHVVTGCNMSGKSTYIRAVALLQIMAQIGSFVPAKFASFSIVHNIFARVSLDDNIESNLSTFSVEMREMAFILRNIDDKSIAVIDELGRATSNRDGLSIAIAMSEALIQSKASVWFATHFTDLTRALADRPGVLNLHLAATTSTTADGLPHITMLYKATAGAVGNEHYGINLARAIGLPQGFINKAEEVAKDLRSKREANKRSSESSRLLKRRNMILNLWAALKQARDSGTEEGLPRHLQHLQAEFIYGMENLESE
ncbi:hypothetical protein CEP53_012072 [Fusarium sp. AF-6]|nr:hypothetical protein CEP53_012072 [Fusarium sp. AF-6]